MLLEYDPLDVKKPSIDQSQFLDYKLSYVDDRQGHCRFLLYKMYMYMYGSVSIFCHITIHILKNLPNSCVCNQLNLHSFVMNDLRVKYSITQNSKRIHISLSLKEKVGLDLNYFQFFHVPTDTVQSETHS